MASRYVVASGTWNASSTTIWSSTNGGSAGASAPTASDDVFLTALSGAVTVTVSGSPLCKSIDATGFTGTISGSATIQVGSAVGTIGDITVSNLMTWGSGVQLLIQATFSVAHTCRLTTGGLTLAGISTQQYVILSLLSDLSCGQLSQVGNSVLTTNDHNITCTSYDNQSVFGNSATFNMGASTVTVTGGGFCWTIAQGGVGTPVINASTSTIVFTQDSHMIGLSKTYNDVKILDGTLILQGNNNYSTLYIPADTTMSFVAGSTHVIGNIVSGGTLGHLAGINSTIADTPAFITTSNVIGVDYIRIKDSQASGTGSWTALCHSVDVSGNSGWIFITDCSIVGLGFAEERRTDYHDWNDVRGDDGSDFDSFFISGFKIHAEMKKFSPMYVYFVSEYHVGSSWLLRALWDFANSDDSNRWSNSQQGFKNTSDRGWVYTRLKIRGTGPALQFKVISEEGKPFYIAGWSSLETANSAP